MKCEDAKVVLDHKIVCRKCKKSPTKIDVIIKQFTETHICFLFVEGRLVTIHTETRAAPNEMEVIQIPRTLNHEEAIRICDKPTDLSPLNKVTLIWQYRLRQHHQAHHEGKIKIKPHLQSERFSFDPQLFVII